VDREMLTRRGLQELATITKGYVPPQDEFYNSSVWKRLSKSYRERNPFCELCSREGGDKQRHTVHHIVPIRNDGPRWDEDNLMALCEDCNSDVHNSQSLHSVPFASSGTPKKESN